MIYFVCFFNHSFASRNEPNDLITSDAGIAFLADNSEKMLEEKIQAKCFKPAAIIAGNHSLAVHSAASCHGPVTCVLSFNTFDIPLFFTKSRMTAPDAMMDSLF